MATRRKKSEDEAPAAGARREILENSILEHAARLFSERGYAGTTPQDIADAVGVSRQNLYYYVKSKEEILARLIADTTTQNVGGVEEIAASEGSGPDRLHRLVRHVVQDRATNSTRFRMLDRSESALPPDIAAEFLGARRAALAATVRVIEDGIAEGWFRNVDARVAALSVLGMCNWVAWWHDPDQPPAPTVIAQEIADNAVAMMSRGQRAAERPLDVIDNIADEVKRLRDIVDRGDQN